MNKSKEIRGSVVDGAVEEVTFEKEVTFAPVLIPVLEEFTESVMTLDGAEEVVRKRVVGFKEKK